MIIRVVLITVLLFTPGRAAAQGSGAAGRTLPGEAMYPRPSRDVWLAVQELLAQLGFRAERKDDRHQVLVTRFRSYDPSLFPDGVAVGLAEGDVAERLQLHLLVDANREPARLAVGTVVELARREGGRRSTVRLYRPQKLEGWFLEALDRHLGVPHEAMAGMPEARRAQAERLMPPELGDPYLSTCRGAKGKMTPPVKISDVRPVFPADGYDSGERAVQVQVVMTEHGTLTNLQVLNPSGKHAQFEASARAATSLWRFRPASWATVRSLP